MNRLLIAGGLVVGIVGGFVTGLWEVALSTLYAGKIPLPVSPLIAIVGNVALVVFTRVVTGRRGLALLPGVAWFAVVMTAAGKTTEGDLPIPGSDWMGLVTILAGSAAWGITAYRMILTTPRTNAVPDGFDESGSAGTGRVDRAVRSTATSDLQDQATTSKDEKPSGGTATSKPQPGARPVLGKQPGKARSGAGNRRPAGRKRGS
jgi:hypothetical protein